MQPTSKIYLIKNKTNDKIYIGFTKQPIEKRMSSHKSTAYNKKINSQATLHKAIRKYGWESFEYDVIYESWDDIYCHNIAEQQLIDDYKSLTITNLGYNDCLGGGGSVYADKKIKEKISKKAVKTRRKNNSYFSWNKGLTKNTSSLLKNIGDKISIKRRGIVPWNKGISHTKKTKEIIGKKSKEKFTEEFTKKFKETISNGIYITPWGNYHSSKDAVKHTDSWFKDSEALRNHCISNNTKIYKKYDYKSPKELGFSFIPKMF